MKSPKIYFWDSGLFHTLLGISDKHALLAHPKLGASWEGFALEEVVRFHQAREEETFFWGTHGEAELDLLIFKERLCLQGIEGLPGHGTNRSRPGDLVFRQT